jgi:nucleotide-binding universal stress UspA family protein
MMSAHVLVPIDGSPLSKKSLEYALETFPGANLTALHVVDLFESGYGTPTDVETEYEPLAGSDEWYARAESASAEILEEASTIAKDQDRNLQTDSEIGDPQRIVVDYAKEENVEQIVLGAHGRHDPDHHVFGAVAEMVTRRATVPVTVVR